jgi:hypothetical protein
MLKAASLDSFSGMALVLKKQNIRVPPVVSTSVVHEKCWSMKEAFSPSLPCNEGTNNPGIAGMVVLLLETLFLKSADESSLQAGQNLLAHWKLPDSKIMVLSATFWCW